MADIETRPSLEPAPQSQLSLMPGYRMQVGNQGPEALYLADGGLRTRIILKNRPFQQVDDDILDSLPSSEIAIRIGRDRVPVSVLDVGGGYLSLAARDLAELYGENVKVTNIDLLLAEDESYSGRVHAVLGDVTNMPIPSESQDVIYSSYALKYLRGGERLLMALREISRVLKPGGIATLHEEQYTVHTTESDKIRKLAETLGLDVTILQGELWLACGPFRYNDYGILILEKPEPPEVPGPTDPVPPIEPQPLS